MSKPRPDLATAMSGMPDAPPEFPRAASKVKDPEPKAASRFPLPEVQTGERGHGAGKKAFTVWLPVELVTEFRDLSKYLKKTGYKNEGSVEALAQAAFEAEIERWQQKLKTVGGE